MSLLRANNPAFPALLPKPVLGLFCGRVVPGSSAVPSESSVIASHSLPAPLCSHVVPESSEVPSAPSVVDSDPKRLPGTWTALLVCGSRILEGPIGGHGHVTTLCVLFPTALCAVALLVFSWSLPAGSLLDRACLLDEGSARVGGFLALTRPAGRAHPRHSQHRASASPLPRPHRRWEEEEGLVMSQMRIRPTRIRRNTDPFKPQVR